MGTVVLQILSIVGMLGSIAIAVCTLVLLMAGGANSSPKQIHELKMMMLGVALVTLIGLVGVIWAFIKARYGMATAFAVLPGAACIGLVVWMWVTEYGT